jgi:iron-sulfur cluster assembly protein
MNVTIAPSAEAFMRRMVRMNGGGGFRLVVTPGGCSGLGSSFSIEREPTAGDNVWERDGLRVFVPPASAALLDGTTVEFADSPTQTGFVIKDPKATSCGCGSGAASVSVASISRRR